MSISGGTNLSTMPSDHLTVAGEHCRSRMPEELSNTSFERSLGDVSFGRGVILRGTVIIVANEGAKIELPDGTILENKLVSGAFYF